MSLSRHFRLSAVAAITTFVAPCFAQELPIGHATPALLGEVKDKTAPVRNWAAPLYWQPSLSDEQKAARAVEPESQRAAAATTAPLVFVGMAPCRVMDTRSGSGFPGSFGPPSITGGTSRTVPIPTSASCAIPSIAQAYSFNVTVVPSGPMYYLTIWPTGDTQPTVSTLNDAQGQILANAAVVTSGTAGSVDIFVKDTTDVILDINGYYVVPSMLALGPGTAAAPSLTFTGDSTSGLYSMGAGAINIATAGVNELTVTSSGVGIGTTAPAAKLEVNGNAQVDGNFSLSGSILENGVGQLLWAPNDTSGNFSAGLGALPATTTGTHGTAIGDGALAVNNGFANTASGYDALFGNTSGNNNTAVGSQALSTNTGGTENTAVGANALTANTTGIENTALGALALNANITGIEDTASGYQALTRNTIGTGNTAGGYGSLADNTTGSYNTGSGASVLAGNTTGSYNTASGFSALSANSTGTNNIAIGYQAGYNVNSTSYNIHIGHQGISTDSGTIRIGTPGTQTSAFIAGIYGMPTGLSAVPVVVDSNGNLGTMSSSRRYKEDIQDMGDASNGLMRLRPVTFRYKKPFDDGSKPVQYGLIAEEVAEVYPDLVARSADGQIETVKYQLLDSMLLSELQKQNATISAQKEQIRLLEERLARVEAALQGTSVSTASR